MGHIYVSGEVFMPLTYSEKQTMAKANKPSSTFKDFLGKKNKSQASLNYRINLGNIPFDNMQFKQHLSVSGLCSHCMAGGIEALPASSSRRWKTI